jgi:tetratricopeptide (TPR) repeat protein
MKKNQFIQNQARNLLDSAESEFLKGDFDDAMRLLDQAIDLLESANIDPTFFKAQRELWRLDHDQSKDFSRLISISEEGLARYRKEQNPVKQIDTLLHIGGFVILQGEKDRAIQYLDEAEAMLSALPPEVIVSYLPLHDDILAGERYINLRKNEINRWRKYIENK